MDREGNEEKSSGQEGTISHATMLKQSSVTNRPILRARRLLPSRFYLAEQKLPCTELLVFADNSLALARAGNDLQ